MTSNIHKNNIIDGRALAEKMRNVCKQQVAELKQRKITPSLAIILVGEDEPSRIYVRNKVRVCHEVGINPIEFYLDKSITESTLIKKLEKLNNDPAVNGIIVQLPLPKHIDSNKIINLIAPEKDVDGFTPINVGKLSIGQAGFIPCTPYGCYMILKKYGVELEGKRVLIVGRSNIVGKPMAMLMIRANATVTIAHSRTKDLGELVRQSDIVISATGNPGMLKGSWFKENSVILDIGISRVGDKLSGDVEFEEAAKRARLITPVPGGVGPMTVACLMENVIKATQLQRESVRG